MLLSQEGLKYLLCISITYFIWFVELITEYSNITFHYTRVFRFRYFYFILFYYYFMRFVIIPIMVILLVGFDSNVFHRGMDCVIILTPHLNLCTVQYFAFCTDSYLYIYFHSKTFEFPKKKKI